MFVEIIAGIGIVMLLIPIWGLICNFRTFNTRMNIIDLISNHNLRMLDEEKIDQMFSWTCFDKPINSYSKHCWSLFFFRDWKRLYDRRLIDLYESQYG